MKRTTIVLLSTLLLAGCTPAIAEEPPTKDYDTEFAYITDWAAEEEPVGFSKVAQEQAEKAEKVAQATQEAKPEPTYYGETYYAEPVYYGGNDYGNPFKSDGVAYLDGREFNWYSQNVLPGYGLDELNANGRHVDESTGFVVDGDGYIAVASPWGQDEIGTVVDTPFGQGKVYDSNEGDAYDLYTDF